MKVWNGCSKELGLDVTLYLKVCGPVLLPRVKWSYWPWIWYLGDLVCMSEHRFSNWDTSNPWHLSILSGSPLHICEFSIRHFLIVRLKLCLPDKMTVDLTLCPSECHVGALDVLVLVCYWCWPGSLQQGGPLVPGCWMISSSAFLKYLHPGTPLHSLKIPQSTTELPPPPDTDMVCVR